MKKDNKGKRTVVSIIVVAVFFYFLTGFVVIRPVGVLTKGSVVWYVRPGVKLPFITSPGKAIASGGLVEATGKRVILRLPYIKFF